MRYIDGYLTPVKDQKKDAYREFSRKIAPIYKEYGALRVVDCWRDAADDPANFHADGARDDLKAGEAPRDFAIAADARTDEVVVFSWTEWPDKETRDRGLAKALAAPRMRPNDGEEMIFDGRRLIAGGFAMILDV